MIRLTTIVLLMIFGLSQSPAIGAKWKRIIPEGGEDYNGLYCVDENNCYTVSRQGSIFSFKKTGDIWSASRYKAGVELKGIYFINNGRRGFAFGAEGMIFIKADTGKGWTSSFITRSVRFVDMVFSDSLNGLMVGYNYKTSPKSIGVMFKTSDGGMKWDSVRIDMDKPTAIHKSTNGTIYITTSNTLLISRDNGNNWEKREFPEEMTPTKTIMEGTDGLLTGMGGFLATTSDEGRNWRILDVIPRTLSIYNALQIGPGMFYITGNEGEILYSTDNGYNWIPELTTAGMELYNIQRVGRYIFVAGKNATLIYTELKE